MPSNTQAAKDARRLMRETPGLKYTAALRLARDQRSHASSAPWRSRAFTAVIQMPVDATMDLVRRHAPLPTEGALQVSEGLGLPRVTFAPTAGSDLLYAVDHRGDVSVWGEDYQRADAARASSWATEAGLAWFRAIASVIADQADAIERVVESVTGALDAGQQVWNQARTDVPPPPEGQHPTVALATLRRFEGVPTSEEIAAVPVTRADLVTCDRAECAAEFVDADGRVFAHVLNGEPGDLRAWPPPARVIWDGQGDDADRAAVTEWSEMRAARLAFEHEVRAEALHAVTLLQPRPGGIRVPSGEAWLGEGALPTHWSRGGAVRLRVRTPMGVKALRFGIGQHTHDPRLTVSDHAFTFTLHPDDRTTERWTWSPSTPEPTWHGDGMPEVPLVREQADALAARTMERLDQYSMLSDEALAAAMRGDGEVVVNFPEGPYDLMTDVVVDVPLPDALFDTERRPWVGRGQLRAALLGAIVQADSGLRPEQGGHDDR